MRYNKIQIKKIKNAQTYYDQDIQDKVKVYKVEVEEHNFLLRASLEKQELRVEVDVGDNLLSKILLIITSSKNISE